MRYDIPFTQYMMPYRRKVKFTITRPKEIYDRAMQIIDAGYCFEAEVLTTGIVSLAISDDECDHDMELANNGPEVLLAIDQMINRFWKKNFQGSGGVTLV